LPEPQPNSPQYIP
jgi:hypothetical protein